MANWNGWAITTSDVIASASTSTNAYSVNYNGEYKKSNYFSKTNHTHSYSDFLFSGAQGMYDVQSVINFMNDITPGTGTGSGY